MNISFLGLFILLLNAISCAENPDQNDSPSEEAVIAQGKEDVIKAVETDTVMTTFPFDRYPRNIHTVLISLANEGLVSVVKRFLTSIYDPKNKDPILRGTVICYANFS